MRSSTVLDLRPAAGDASTVRDLLVLWQHPTTREIIPIGKLSYDSGTYSFVYTRAAASILDFRPLPGLNDLHVRYSSHRLPSVFGQRIMDSDRPDFEHYLRTLGLDASRATPWEQIVHSGGARAGDTLQFMEMPEVIDGVIHARFLANGVRHIPDEERNIAGRLVRVSPEQHETALGALRPGDQLVVEPELNNSHDPDAAVITHEGVPLGYVPRFLSSSVRELLRWGPVLPVVVRVGEPDTPSHLRLVVDIEQAGPPGFSFDREGRWEPITA